MKILFFRKLFIVHSSERVAALCLLAATCLLSACAYNGLSGSSAPVEGGLGSSGGGTGSPSIDGLWVQAVPTDVDGQGEQCGCTDQNFFSDTYEENRRCFNYFRNGMFVAGYLLPGLEPNQQNCAAPYNPTDNQREILFRELDMLFARGSGASTPPVGPTMLVASAGSFDEVGTERRVSINGGESINNGTYIDLTYPRRSAPTIIGIHMICTSYAWKDDNLYLAADPSGGTDARPRDPEVCNANRLTGLIHYTKIERN